MLQRCIRTQRPYLEQHLVPWSSFRRHLIHERRSLFFVTNRSHISARLYETTAVVRKRGSTAVAEQVETVNVDKCFRNLCSRWSAPVEKQKILVKIRDSIALSSLFRDHAQLKAALDSLIQHNTPHLLPRALDMAVQAGSILRASIYEFLCYRLAPEKRWDVILRVVESASRALPHLTTRLLNWRARSLIELQEYQIASQILEEFQQAKQTPNQRTYHILISGCLRNADMHGAKHLLNLMRQAGLPMTPELHALIVQHYRDFGLNADILQATLDILPTLERPLALDVLNSLIQMTIDSADYRTTIQLLDYFNEAPTARFRSLILPLCPENPRSQHHAVDTTTNHPDPDSTTASLFMNFLVANSASQDAVQLGEEILAKDLVPTEAFVASLINAYFMAGQVDNATMLLARICGMTTTSNFQQLKTSSENCGHVLGNVEHLAPSTKLFNAYLKGICKRDGEKIPVVFEIMELERIQPNSRTVEILLSFIKSKRVHPHILVHALKALTSPSIPVNIRHLHQIISAIASYDKYMKYGRGWNSFSAKFGGGRIREDNRISRTVSASSNPSAGITVQDIPSYRKLLGPFLQSLSERGIKSDAAMLFLRLRLDALDADMESAESIFKMLLARGISPNRYHFTAMIDGYARKGDFTSALFILQSTAKSSVKPTVEMYTCIISAYARRHDPASASKIFQRMLDNEIYPDVAAIDALVSAYYAVGAYKIARLMLIALWKYIAPFPESMNFTELSILIKVFRKLDTNGNQASGLMERDRVRIYNQIASLVDSYQRHLRT